MKIYAFVDTDIPQKELHKHWSDYAAFVSEHTGITPKVHNHRYDFSTYPTFFDADGDPRPTPEFVKTLVRSMEEEKGRFGADHIFLLIHEDNWRSSGPIADRLYEQNGRQDEPGDIWGINFSHVHGPYHVHYCRWDRDNAANSFGTTYHEAHHSFDALCKVEAGVRVEPLLKVDRYDRDCTHGGARHWDYIRYKENAESLEILAPHLKAAYAARREKEREDKEEQILGLKKTLLGLLKRKLYKLRAYLNRKDGVQT